MRAHIAQEKMKTERQEILAWMIGNYTALAYHAPNKYPRKPRLSGTATNNKEMAANDMKSVLRQLMKQQEEVSADGGHAGRT